MGPERVVTLRRSSLALCIALGLVAPAAADEDTVPPFDPRRRVYTTASDLAPPEALLRLEATLVDTETRSHWRYYVILAPLGGNSPWRVARQVVARWEREPDFEPERSFVVVADAAGTEAGLLPPRGLQDRLGLSLGTLEALLRPQPRPQPDPVELLIEVVARAEARLGALEAEREADAARRALEYQERGTRQDEARGAGSRRLLDLELRCGDLERSGLLVRDEERVLTEARRDLQRAILVLPFAPEEGSRHLDMLEQALGRIEARFDQLERDRREVPGRLVELQARLDQLESRPEAREATERARGALARAREHVSGGQPDLALQDLTQASEALQRATSTPAARPASVSSSSSSSWPWLAAGAGLFLVGALLMGGGGPAAAEVEALELLRRATVQQADELEAELRALRGRHLQASRPPRIEVPERLRFEPAPPASAELAGETLVQLTRARARLEGLHASWRTLRQAVAHADALRASHGWGSRRGVADALQVLRRVPTRSLPLAALRQVEEDLGRVEAAPAACSRALAEAAQALEGAERRLEDVLKAGQGTQAFEDALGELLERAHQGAFWAERDPVGAARVAAETRALGAILEERVKRTLEVSLGLAALQARLSAAGSGLSTPPAAARPDRSSLVAWAHQLSEEAAQALDEGSREEARRGFERALALLEDAELLGKGPVEGPEAELELLRQELRQAHQDLQRLRADFAPTAWDDVEVVLLRAVGRLELVSIALAEGRRVPRLRARLQEVRTAALLVSARLQQSQVDRDQARGLIPLLDQRLVTLEGVVSRDLGGSCSRGLQGQLKTVRAELGEVRAAAALADDEQSGATPPDWGALHARLRGLEEGLELLRLRLGEELLRFRRARELEALVGKGIKATEDLINLHAPGRPGPPLRLRAARAALERAQTLLQGEARDLRQAITLLSLGVECCRGAREILVRKGGLDLLPSGGARSDALRALLQAHAAFGQAHRQFLLGRTDEPAGARALLRQAGGLLDGDPLRALSVAEEAWTAAEELALAGRLAEGTAEDTLYAAEFESRLRLRQAARTRERAAQRDELRRRARFELLVLDQDDAQVEVEDIDAGEDPAELASLEEAVGEPSSAEASALAAEPAVRPAATRVTATSPPEPTQPGAVEPEPEAAVAPDPGATANEPDPGAVAPDPGATVAAEPGATVAPEPGATVAAEPGTTADASTSAAGG